MEGLINNPAAGYNNYNPVPLAYRNSHCGPVTGDGNQGGFKLWRTNGVTIENNWIHHNYGPGAWADTGNANTTFYNNNISNNIDIGIVEEISYNFSITNNYLKDNGWLASLNNTGFPYGAIYISESGSDTSFGGIPKCSEASYSGQGWYPNQSVISNNTLVDNSGSIVLWENSNRYCDDGFDGLCTWVEDALGPFTLDGCGSNFPSATVNTTTYVGNITGNPAKDWWDGCQWWIGNVLVSQNQITFHPAHIAHCTSSVWPTCGAGGIFIIYGGPSEPGWVIPTEITFFKNNVFSTNVYIGPSLFWAWSQGNGDNPVDWAEWSGPTSQGDKCSSSGEQQSGYCTGPFGQDVGST